MRHLLAFSLSLFLFATLSAADKKIILIAGSPSHPAGEHEHRAGMLLLQKSLAGYPGVSVEVQSLTGRGWVADESIFNDAAAVLIYADGGGGHPLLQEDRLQKVAALAAKGIGIGFLHYATEALPARGTKEFIDWTGGAFEINYSVNPIFLGEFKALPQHPVTRGVRPFATTDEWYYNIRFPEGMRGVTPILSLVPPLSSLNRPYAPVIEAHAGNEIAHAAVRRGDPQHVMWVTERPDGGRGFGFSGGHYHANWANDDQRKLVLNAILWVAKVDVPPNGVQSPPVTTAMLRANLDPKGGRGGAAVNPAASSIPALASLHNANVTEARRRVNSAVLATPRDDALILRRVQELAEAERVLALARSATFLDVQSTPERLNADQVAALVRQAAGLPAVQPPAPPAPAAAPAPAAN